MKFATPANPNYAATIVRVRVLNDLPNCDNVVGMPVQGYQAIVGKGSHAVGELAVYFPAETQLSEEYAKQNNLFRDKAMNIDPEKVGYLEENRRIRAIKFRKQRSDALVMPLSSLAFTGVDITQFNEHDTFDTLGGISICQKYEVKIKNMTTPAGTKAKSKVDKAFRRVDAAFMPEHLGTDMWFRNAHTVPNGTELVITQKLHGTSIRIGHVPVRRQPTLVDKIAKFFGAKIQDKEFAYIYGSRRVIKDANNPNHVHFYSSDIWTTEGRKYQDVLPKGFIIYGELIGWVGDSPIQGGYTYNVPKGEAHLYVYRVAVVNDDARTVDLSWDAVRQFCADNGLKHAPELFRTTKENLMAGQFRPDGNYDETYTMVDQLMDLRYTDAVESGYIGEVRDPMVPLSDDKTVDEGICLRYDYGTTPMILKAKSPIFYGYETAKLDKGEVDLESSQSEVDPESTDAA